MPGSSIRRLSQLSLLVAACVLLGGCNGRLSSEKASPPAPPELSAVYLAYDQALRAGDGAKACGMATTRAQALLVRQANPNFGAEYCPQVVAGFAESVRSHELPIVNTGSAGSNSGLLIITQKFSDQITLQRRVFLKYVDGRWLFDGINNIVPGQQ